MRVASASVSKGSNRSNEQDQTLSELSTYLAQRWGVGLWSVPGGRPTISRWCWRRRAASDALDENRGRRSDCWRAGPPAIAVPGIPKPPGHDRLARGPPPPPPTLPPVSGTSDLSVLSIKIINGCCRCWQLPQPPADSHLATCSVGGLDWIGASGTLCRLAASSGDVAITNNRLQVWWWWWWCWRYDTPATAAIIAADGKYIMADRVSITGCMTYKQSVCCLVPGTLAISTELYVGTLLLYCQCPAGYILVPSAGVAMAIMVRQRHLSNMF